MAKLVSWIRDELCYKSEVKDAHKNTVDVTRVEPKKDPSECRKRTLRRLLDSARTDRAGILTMRYALSVIGASILLVSAVAVW